MLMQHVARDNSGLSLARRRDATCFSRWIMSVISPGVLLKNVQSPVTREARVRTPLGDRVERGVMARSVASDPKTHHELEGWTRSGDGISHERSLWSASKCEVPSRVSDGQPMWQPLSITHGDGRGVQPDGIDRQILLSAQMCKTGSDVTLFTQAVEEDPRNSAERTKE